MSTHNAKSNSQFKPASWYRDQFGVSSGAMRIWESDGKVQAIRCPGGKRLYHRGSVEKLLGRTITEEEEKKSYIYARVSSPKQSEDLERQIKILKEAYPQHSIIKDIGSGLNFKRQGLRTLLDRIYEGVVGEIVVLHKDRLSRFASWLLEYFFEKSGVRLVVHSPCKDLSNFSDLADDLLAVTTFFVASHNGKRSAEHKRIRRQQEEQREKEEGKQRESSESEKRNKRKRDDEDGYSDIDRKREGIGVLSECKKGSQE